MSNVDDYGKRLKKARLAKGVTQQQAAIDLGISPGTYLQYENNNAIPRGVNKVVALADYMGVSLDWLYKGSEKDKQKQDDNTILTIKIVVE